MEKEALLVFEDIAFSRSEEPLETFSLVKYPYSSIEVESKHLNATQLSTWTIDNPPKKAGCGPVASLPMIFILQTYLPGTIDTTRQTFDLIFRSFQLHDAIKYLMGQSMYGIHANNEARGDNDNLESFLP